MNMKIATLWALAKTTLCVTSKKATLCVAGCVLLASSASAAPIVLTFSEFGVIPTSSNNGVEPVLNFYDGGYAGNGTASCGFSVCGPGPNYGISFESNALVATSKLQGGNGNFDGMPNGGTNSMSFLVGTGDVMNVAGGFTTGFSFYYSAPRLPGTVTVWSGPDATGTMLASLSLSTTPDGKTYGAPCSSLYLYCPWEPFGVTFSGTAESVDFSGTANRIGFDDITLGSATPGPSSTGPGTGTSSTPEPVSLVLAGTGLLAIALRRRRRTGLS